jgi:hypothetical protein
MRWFGNLFIWNQSPQHPRAIDLMYHAAGSTNGSIRYNAIYFGIATVRPMTEPILRTLVEIGMQTEDPNTLTRIAWGGAAHRDRLLHLLEPHERSEDPSKREHAQTLKKIFSGELEAFAWAAEQAKARAQAKYGPRLEEFRNVLATGESDARRELLELLLRERIYLAMDKSFIPAFAGAAKDPDVRVRELVTIIAGDHWVWKSKNQPEAAIDLMLQLSHDPERKVRYNANYYGLSTIRNRTEPVVERMLELAMSDGINDQDFRRRITWGLKNDQKISRRILNRWISQWDKDRIRAAFAYGFYLDQFAEQAETPEGMAALIEAPDKEAALVVVLGPTTGAKFASAKEFADTTKAALPEELRARMHLADGLPFLIITEAERANLEKQLLTNPKIKIMDEQALSLTKLIQLGKTGTLKDK